MWKESLKQEALTEPKPSPDLNRDYKKSVPGREATQVKQIVFTEKKKMLTWLLLEAQIIVF